MRHVTAAYAISLSIAVLVTMLSGVATAAALRVSPVILDQLAPTSATGLKLWNDSDQSVEVQIRVFRWVQSDGEQRYEPTRDVVASPPITTLQPGSENIIRVIRLKPEPVVGEESYRLIVDELPNPSLQQGGNITVVLRHSIPVFFSEPVLDGPEVEWDLEPTSDGLVRLSARNYGSKRLKISNLALSGADGEIFRRTGLLGYVLGNAEMSWTLNASDGLDTDKLLAGPLTLSADSEAGKISAVGIE